LKANYFGVGVGIGVGVEKVLFDPDTDPDPDPIHLNEVHNQKLKISKMVPNVNILTLFPHAALLKIQAQKAIQAASIAVVFNI